MNIENQEVSVKCRNSECGLYGVQIILDMYQYKIIRKLDGVECVACYELPHFYCSECFWELPFIAKEKKCK